VTESPCVDFLRRLIQTPSLPGREERVAALVTDEMRRLGFDEVGADEAGNVIGLVRGRGRAPAMMFNTHLDHVDVGDEARWPHPPYGAELHDGRVWGRGAVDIKGPLAAQVHAVGALVQEGVRPDGDVYVTSVVQEEVGGFGARHLVSHLTPPLVIVGEPSGNQLRRGHRGRTELEVHVTGRSVHASVPELGRNPLQVVAEIIRALARLPMRSDPELGVSSVATTMIRTDQTSTNVVPGEAWLTCDWRSVPGESSADVQRTLREIAEAARFEGTEVEVTIPASRARTYTGRNAAWPTHHPAFLLAVDDPALLAAARVIGDAIGPRGPAAVWRFATDGGHFAAAGQTVVGFGPGDETLAHTVNEHLEIDALHTAMRAYQALAASWPGEVERLATRPRTSARAPDPLGR
jgi:putative selenium metabolism hydrolase